MLFQGIILQMSSAAEWSHHSCCLTHKICIAVSTPWHWPWLKQCGVVFFFSVLGLLRACAGGRTRAGGKGRKLVLPLVWQEFMERWLTHMVCSKKQPPNLPALSCSQTGAHSQRAWTLSGSEFPALYCYASVMHPWKKIMSHIWVQITMFLHPENIPRPNTLWWLTKYSQHLERRYWGVSPPSRSPLFTEALLKREEKEQAQGKQAWNWTNPRCTSKASQYQTETVQFRCI